MHFGSCGQKATWITFQVQLLLTTSGIQMMQMPFELFKISMQSVTWAVQAKANVNCYCIICIVQKFLARIKCWIEFVILYSGEIFWCERSQEVAKTWTKVVRFSQQSSIESKEQIKLKTKWPFIIDWWVSQESRIETQQSTRLDSRFSRGLRIECQLTFERYCTTNDRRQTQVVHFSNQEISR